jgi:hypothetical protein
MKILEVTQSVQPVQPTPNPRIDITFPDGRTSKDTDKLKPAVKPVGVKPTGKVVPISQPSQMGQMLQGAGIPNIDLPATPPLPQQAGSGEKIETLPNGTTSYTGGFGRYIYDKTGKPLTYQTPSFSGLSQTNDLVTGNITVRYAAGPLDVTTKFDKTGKPLDSTKIQYDLGLGVMGYEKDKGITATTWQDRGDNVVQSRDMVKDPAAYDRAMAQVQQTTNEELNTVLKIAGLR